MLHRAILAGILQLALSAAWAEGYTDVRDPAVGLRLTQQSPANPYAQAPGLGWDGAAASSARARQAGILPLGLDTRVGYDVAYSPGTDPTARLTTLHTLSRTDTLNLRLERQGERRAYWSRAEGAYQQRVGLFPATIGTASRHLVGWQYAKGYALAGESLPSSSGVDLKPTGALRHNPRPSGLSPAVPPIPYRTDDADGVGKQAATAFAREHGRARQAVRGDGLMPRGRRDYRLAAGSAADGGIGFLGGELREGLTPDWTVEAGGHVEQTASVYAKTRLRMGPGLLRMETRSDTGTHHSTQRLAYVLGSAAVSVDRLHTARSLGARFSGHGYYAAYDHGLSDDDRRLSAGYSTDLESGRVSVYCEARGGSTDSRYCGVGWQVPLQPGGIGRAR